MEVKAISRFVRISPSKVHDLARAIRGMSAPDAVKTMQFIRRKGACLLLKTLNSAIANAENNAKLSAENLLVKEVQVETGPTMKRFRARARGSASPIRKRTSHLRIVLTEKPSVKAEVSGKEAQSRGTEG